MLGLNIERNTKLWVSRLGTLCGVFAMLVLVTGCPWGEPPPVACETDADCPDNDVFCDGVPVCDMETLVCVAGEVPCAADYCDEELDVCAECLADDECDDADLCTDDACVDGVCVFTAVDCGDQMCDPADGGCVDCLGDADCDDGLFCTGDETCVAGACVAGTDPCDPDTEVCIEVSQSCSLICTVAADCDDGDECTVDTCTEGVCLSTVLDCDDDLFCTGVETCDPATGCVSPGDPCAEGETCDEETGTCLDCVVCVDDADCLDDVFCNGTETCVEGCCLAGEAVDCDDDDLCTTDVCDPDTDACTNDPVVCPEGEICDPETGGCVAACLEDADCDDDNPCTDDACVDGECVNTEITCPAGEECVDGECVEIECTADEDCDDGISCTVDTCEISTGTCLFTEIDARCDDGQYCTGTGTCVPADADADPDTGCVMTGDPCANPTPVCNEATDACEGCDDDAECDDGYACTIDDCNTLTGVCSWTPADVNCPDPLFCDGPDICDPSHLDADADGCVATGDPCDPKPCDEAIDECFNCDSNADCDDGILCTVDACNGVTGDCTHTADDTLCHDPLFCDGVDFCDPTSDYADGAGCVPPYSYPCVLQACNETADICFACTSNADCDDGIDCTDDTCDGGTGFCTNADNCGVLTCNPYTGECE